MAAYVAQGLTYSPFRKPWIISSTVSNKYQKLASRWKQRENQNPCVPLVGRENGVPHWLTWWLLKSLNTQVVETAQWIKASLESIKGSGRRELGPHTHTLIKWRVVGQVLAIALLSPEVETTALTNKDKDTTCFGCRTKRAHCNRVRGFPAS